MFLIRNWSQSLEPEVGPELDLQLKVESLIEPEQRTHLKSLEFQGFGDVCLLMSIFTSNVKLLIR